MLSEDRKGNSFYVKTCQECRIVKPVPMIRMTNYLFRYIVPMILC
jgi:hypothetical protein